MSATLEEYLKIMYILQKQNGVIRVTDIANALECSKPSVNRAIKVLCEDNLLEYEVYGKIFLTESGIKKAESILRTHNILKAFFVQVLELESEKAEIEASNIEHAISETTVQKLENYISSIIDVSNLGCNYDPNCLKCRNCINKNTKLRFKLKNNR